MKKRRAGSTKKLSISLEAKDVAFLERRAAKLYRGNVSAAVTEGVRRLEEEQGREALAEWLGKKWGEPTEREKDAIRAEWRGKKRTKAA